MVVLTLLLVEEEEEVAVLTLLEGRLLVPATLTMRAVMVAHQVLPILQVISSMAKRCRDRKSVV